MGFHIDYDERNNVVRVRARGTLNRDGFDQALEQLRGLPLRPGYRELVDLRAVREFDIEPLYLRRVAAHVDSLHRAATEGSRRAIVAPSDVGYGMARMYELARGPEPHGDLRVFRDVVEARDWLGISRHRQRAG